MIILGDFAINLSVYLGIGFTIAFFLIIYYLYIDFTNDEEYVSVMGIINDIGEGLCIGLSWLVSIPILAITNIVKYIILLIYHIRYANDKEEDDE